jgi:hypothetical protein
MTTIDRLHFTRACLREAWVESLVSATSGAQELGARLASSRKAKLLATSGIAGALALHTQAAHAQRNAADPNSCPSGAEGKIVQLFQRIGWLLYAIAAIFALVGLAGAALMFMASGNNQRRADMGMKWAKNIMIGLAILAGGYFFRNIAVEFVSNASASAAGQPGQADQGAIGLLDDCAINQPTTR